MDLFERSYSHLRTVLSSLAVALIGGVHCLNAVVLDGSAWNPRREYFDQEIAIMTVADSLPGQPQYRFLGTDIVLDIDTLPGDLVTWKWNDSVLQHSEETTIQITNLEAINAGNYRATITRDDVQVTSYPLVLNVVPRPTTSVVDDTFVSPKVQGLEAIPRFVHPDGSIAVLYISGSLYSPRWVWLDSDGREKEEILATSGPITSNGVLKFFNDGSYLLRTVEEGISLILPDGTKQFPAILTDHAWSWDRAIKQDNHHWIVADSIDLTGFDAAGAVTFTKNVSDYGVITIDEIEQINDRTGRFLLIGAVGDGPTTYATQAVLVNPDGAPTAGFQRITFEGKYPTQLRDGTWAHFHAGVLRTFDANGNLIHTAEIPNATSNGADAISPDGWLYIAIPKTGIVRFDRLGNRDPDYAYHFSTTHVSFRNLFIFDQEDRPILSIRNSVSRSNDESQVIRLRKDMSILDAPPLVAIETEGSPSHQKTWSTSGIAAGSGAMHYQWLRLDQTGSQPLPPGAVMNFERLQAKNMGLYQLKVSSPVGTIYSDIIDIRPRGRPVLGNLSGRGRVDENHSLVAGFVTDSWRRPETSPTSNRARIVLRGIGPTLADFGVNSPLPDPVLSFENRQSGQLLTNDDWTETDVHTSLSLRAHGVFPLRNESADSRLIMNLPVGIFTSTVAAKEGESGIALAEVQALGTSHSAELANLSLRGNVGSGEDVLIGGFIVKDPDQLDRPLRVLIRAVGPTLEAYDVEGVCRDPRLTLFNADGEAIATNNDWQAGSDADIAALAATLGAFELPAGSKDAALVIELPPGAYTGHVTDEAGPGGEALFEIYRIPPE